MLPVYSLTLPLLLAQHVWGAEPNQPPTPPAPGPTPMISPKNLWPLCRYIAAQPEVHWPGLCLQDSPLGIRFADRVTAFPAGINAGATWDRDMIRRRGEAMAREFKGKGVHVALGPMMNLGRVLRVDETGKASSYETIIGIQNEGVQACAKHYINNEQEHYRTTSSSNVDDRTQHELYAHPFLRSVMAGVASVMCSYSESLQRLYFLHGEMVSLGAYLYNHAESVLPSPSATIAGFALEGHLNPSIRVHRHCVSSVTVPVLVLIFSIGKMTMPGDITFHSNDSYFGANLTAAVKNGEVTEDRVTDMAERIVAAWYLVGQDKGYPDVNFDSFRPQDPINKHVDVQEDHYKLVREMGAASTVLLKNVNDTLPLKKPITIALIGSDAGPAQRGPNGYADRGGLDGTLAMGWGSGTAEFPYLISPLEALQQRAKQDHTTIGWWLNDWDTVGAANAAANKDVALVFVASDSGEQYIAVDGNEGDRNNLTAWHNGDELVKAVAAANKNTVVVVHSVGPIIVEPWVDHPNVTAILWAGLPGQESGNSLVDIVYGDVNPSAKLPYTIAKKPEDYSAQVVYNDPSEQPQIPYTEGLLIDYRWFDAKNIEPRYEFGFGLSYTTFEYSNLKVARAEDALSKELIWWDGGVSGNKTGASIETWLHDALFKVSFTVKNTGKVAGSEVAQLYINPPAGANEPPSVLRGFDKIKLAPGESKTVELVLSRYDLSIWDVERQGGQGWTELLEFGWARAAGTRG
ncbi:Glycosyl hydrolase family 3 C-terminal domain [Rhizoctonia solani]|uniref:beta-glucosidase n=1 Tax=Rhizoctonia solani TaxID=456999 RepID=A0A8H7M214_9AGAM|nr:Glycosyl hydrolase family 3 C-terminal domain [Rhizoctonia solani]